MTKLQHKITKTILTTKKNHMAKVAPYESPFRIRKAKQREEIISSYYQMKKNPKNSATEWKKQIALQYEISEYTVANYLRNRNK